MRKAHSIESLLPSTHSKVLLCAFASEVIDLFMSCSCRWPLGLGLWHMEYLVLRLCLAPAVPECCTVDEVDLATAFDASPCLVFLTFCCPGCGCGCGDCGHGRGRGCGGRCCCRCCFCSCCCCCCCCSSPCSSCCWVLLFLFVLQIASAIGVLTSSCLASQPCFPS